MPAPVKPQNFQLWRDLLDIRYAFPLCPPWSGGKPHIPLSKGCRDGSLRCDLVRYTAVIQTTEFRCAVEIAGLIYRQRAEWGPSVQTTGEGIQGLFRPLTSGGRRQLVHGTAPVNTAFTAPATAT